MISLHIGKLLIGRSLGCLADLCTLPPITQGEFVVVLLLDQLDPEVLDFFLRQIDISDQALQAGCLRLVSRQICFVRTHQRQRLVEVCSKGAHLAIVVGLELQQRVVFQLQRMRVFVGQRLEPG